LSLLTGSLVSLADWSASAAHVSEVNRLSNATMSIPENLHRAIEFLPALAKFAVFMALVAIIPRLSRRVRLPEAVGLLLSGVVLGLWTR
jgi:hypothetical protein